MTSKTSTRNSGFRGSDSVTNRVMFVVLRAMAIVGLVLLSPCWLYLLLVFSIMFAPVLW